MPTTGLALSATRRSALQAARRNAEAHYASAMASWSPETTIDELRAFLRAAKSFSPLPEAADHMRNRLEWFAQVWAAAISRELRRPEGVAVAGAVINALNTCVTSLLEHRDVHAAACCTAREMLCLELDLWCL